MTNEANIIYEILQVEGVVPLTAALSGSIIGGIFPYLIARYNQANNRRMSLDSIKINKLESTYTTLLEIEQAYRCIYSRASHLLQTVESATKELERLDNTSENRVIPFGQLEMFIALYAPDLLKETKDFIETAQEFSGRALNSEIFFDDKSDQERKSEWESLGEQYEKVTTATEELKGKITLEMNSTITG